MKGVWRGEGCFGVVSIYHMCMRARDNQLKDSVQGVEIISVEVSSMLANALSGDTVRL